MRDHGRVARRVRERALLTAWRVRGDRSPEAPTVVGGLVPRLNILRQVRSCHREAMSELEVWRSQALYTLPATLIYLMSRDNPPRSPPSFWGWADVRWVPPLAKSSGWEILAGGESFRLPFWRNRPAELKLKGKLPKQPPPP